MRSYIMGGSTVYLPDGQTITVTPVFAGLFFKSNELTTHRSPFPAGWTTVLRTQESEVDASTSTNPSDGNKAPASPTAAPVATEAVAAPGQGLAASPALIHAHSFRRPTLQNDSLFISSISNPSSSDFKPAASPTRQIAMMLWVTLYWYFHQPEPDALLPATAASQSTPTGGRPRGEWRIHIQRDGVLRGRNLLPKLERMGLIATLDTAVQMAGTSVVVGDGEQSGGWDNMYVSQSIFWQMSAQLFLFTLQPALGSRGGTTSHPGSPSSSRPGSPAQEKARANGINLEGALLQQSDAGSPGTEKSLPIGPFTSSSHLPTYYPPGPLRYTTTNGVRHPARPKPPRMGEVFYSRYVPSAGQYLSLRVASSSPRAVPYQGPVGPQPAASEQTHLTTLSDTALLELWLSKPRVSAFWGNFVPDFLTSALASKHSFPVIAMWDGVPFGYFEIYWVKEDILGRSVSGAVAATDFDRGLHVFIGEEWARGRVQQWLSSVVHWILTSDYRTMSVCIEPRVDNVRFIQHLQLGGFNKQCEVTFPHKQSWFGRLYRDGWTGPAL